MRVEKPQYEELNKTSHCVFVVDFHICALLYSGTLQYAKIL